MFLFILLWLVGPTAIPATATDPDLLAVRQRDTDGDGLPDLWEIRGYDADGDGIVDIDLPAMGADPQHKDIFVEADWMDGATCHRRPPARSIQGVVQAFARAPVRNPDGTTGINLHVDYGQGGSYQGGNAISCQDPVSWPDGFQALKAANFDPRRRAIFHYALFGLGFDDADSTGISETPGDDLFITLKQPNVFNQASTFMHELGHNLGLKHGGLPDAVPYKPNHLSVMNYSFQFTGVILKGETGILDYARSTTCDLDETALNEQTGMGCVPAYGTIWYCENDRRKRITNNTTEAIDWNCDGRIEEETVATSINKDRRRTVLRDPGNEWAALRYQAGNIGSSRARSEQFVPLAARGASQTELEQAAQQTRLAAKAILPPPFFALTPASSSQIQPIVAKR
ncbi:zinc-dependent metalloprotease family protein [Anthocerotibacter panamensis]|uniref:zinc-dependent metalloprotease family protein n=1 Tax=Anthocerotibacter panamensis TaxID=2857077 RepID=UPI001C4051AD|nr:zinc-dependent metalloprotease family protein [Anthocerotibacter panamensis]